jgi:hypothetical protein
VADHRDPAPDHGDGDSRRDGHRRNDADAARQGPDDLDSDHLF